MIRHSIAAISLSMIGALTPATAAEFDDPTWPCIQRKVENLSIGLMWPVLLEEESKLDAQTMAAVSEMAELLSLRRIDLEGLEGDVAAFAASFNGDAEVLGRVFEAVFKSLATRRSRIINGIGEFSLGQIALADKIDGLRVEMDTEMAKDAPDFDKVDSLEEQLDWDQVIYTDRQQSITYLCETPVLLEKRLYAVARLLQNEIKSE